MKKPLPIFFIFLVASLTAFAAELPQFTDYPVAGIYQGENFPIKLTTTEAREFRTRLTEAARQKPNFASHYIITRWGCGSGCTMPAIIDAKNGHVYMVPFTITTVGEEVIDPIQFRIDSRLVIVNGSRDERSENGSFYYLWNGKNLELVRSLMK